MTTRCRCSTASCTPPSSRPCARRCSGRSRRTPTGPTRTNIEAATLYDWKLQPYETQAHFYWADLLDQPAPTRITVRLLRLTPPKGLRVALSVTCRLTLSDPTYDQVRGRGRA